ncbi:MAG: TIR domain-containing protein, partial [Saccharothrix sp.]|nr:TIR domain-containing protein [Saccharothrix sp.]
MPPPRVFLSYADDSGAHTAAVLDFARRLRTEHGIEVHLDLWARDRRRDWVDWAVEQIDTGDFVLAIASEQYKRLAEPDSAAGDGSNARFQLAMLREHLAADRPRWLPRILPVVLAGYSADDLPAFLQPYSATKYVLPGQLDELLRVLHGQPRHLMPALAPPVDPARWQQGPLFRTTPVGAELSRMLVEAAERLAGAVTTVWRGEVDRLRLNVPRPLATRYAVDGVPYDRIGSLLGEHALNRRAVLLGGPGSGKSVAALRLVSEALERWAPGEPVPILVPVTDWNPDELHAFDWLARRLARDHRLGGPLRWVDGRTTTLAAALLEVGLVQPVLDGLETLADDLRPRAITALNRLGSSVPLVITCGLAEYRELEAAGLSLARATRAELLPLDRDDVEQYLTEKVPHGTTRMAPLFTRLRDEPVPTPLVVWLLGTVYETRDRDPSELCDPTRFPDPASIEAHLLTHLIPSVYPDDPPPQARQPFPRQHHTVVERWLSHLAETPDIAWWRLHRSLP